MLLYVMKQGPSKSESLLILSFLSTLNGIWYVMKQGPTKPESLLDSPRQEGVYSEDMIGRFTWIPRYKMLKS